MASTGPIGAAIGGAVGLLVSAFGISGGSPQPGRADEQGVVHRPEQFNTAYSPHAPAAKVNSEEVKNFMAIANAYPDGAFFEDIFGAFDAEVQYHINNGNRYGTAAKSAHKVMQWFMDKNFMYHGKVRLDDWFRDHPELKPTNLLARAQAAQQAAAQQAAAQQAAAQQAAAQQAAQQAAAQQAAVQQAATQPAAAGGASLPKSKLSFTNIAKAASAAAMAMPQAIAPATVPAVSGTAAEDKDGLLAGVSGTTLAIGGGVLLAVVALVIVLVIKYK